MTYPDTEQGVWAMFYCVLDLPQVTRVERLGPGEWRVFFGDRSEATAYPLEGRFEEDPATVRRRLF
ncbi:MAG: hypothetical protein ACOH2H_11050 [Cypionkella sp.]